MRRGRYDLGQFPLQPLAGFASGDVRGWGILSVAMICPLCQFEFPDECGKYGCPNCNGEGLEDHDDDAAKDG